MSLPLPVSPRFSENRERYPCKDGEYNCVVCGRPTRLEGAYCLRVINGGTHLATTETEAEIDPAGDLYCLPIGQSCLRRHPELKPWARR